MRLYSNTLLSWSQTIHVVQATRLYPGQWLNYYCYRITNINPLILTTHSPIELLQENCQYYCYTNYHRDKSLEQYGNTLVSTNIHNKNLGEKTWVHIPKIAEVDDIIAIHNNIGYPNIVNPIRNFIPSLTLQ